MGTISWTSTSADLFSDQLPFKIRKQFIRNGCCVRDSEIMETRANESILSYNFVGDIYCFVCRWQEVPRMTGRVLIVMLVLSVGGRVVSQATDQTSDEPVSEEEDLPVRRDAGDWPKKSRGHTTAPSTSPCRCWNTTDESLATEVECQCRGLSVKSIPSDLSTNVHRMWVDFYNFMCSVPSVAI